MPEEPRSWCVAPAVWPEGPFTAPEGATYDLVSIEQYAYLSQQAALHWGDHHGTKKAVEAAAGVADGQLRRLINGEDYLLSFDVLSKLFAAMGQEITCRRWDAAHFPDRVQMPARVQQPGRILKQYPPANPGT